jgi:hypothetical protein
MTFTNARCPHYRARVLHVEQPKRERDFPRREAVQHRRLLFVLMFAYAHLAQPIPSAAQHDRRQEYHGAFSVPSRRMLIINNMAKRDMQEHQSNDTPMSVWSQQ